METPLCFDALPRELLWPLTVTSTTGLYRDGVHIGGY